MNLSEPHFSQTRDAMEALGLNVSDFLINELGFGRLSLKRTILKASISNSKQKKAVRFRSKCEINGKQVTQSITFNS